jgi:hypothetical protein
MVNSFKTWEDVSESTRSKQVYVAPNGRKFKVVIRMFSNAKFMVKTVNEMGLLDSRNNMTNAGATALKSYLNSQQAFLNTVGNLNSSFFSINFIVYTVVKNNRRKEKMQFVVVPRASIEGLDPSIQFVSTDALTAIQNKTEEIEGIIKVNVDDATNNDVEGETEEAEDGEIDDGKGSEVTEESLGNRFRYTMSTNGVTYVCTIGGGGAIEMEPYQNAQGAVGAISWEDPKIVWYTDADNNGAINNTPLYTDTEITNKHDKDFFTKMFTDKEFKDSVIREYEDEYGDSEMNGENLRHMLYYENGTQLFPTSASNSDTAAVSGTTHTSTVDSQDVTSYINT